MPKVYDPSEIEEKIYEFWNKNGFFKSSVNKNKKSYTISMPPPNITGKLHMGHALDNTIQDILVRFKRMNGYEALWVPGTDHAAIATEAKIVSEMAKEGIKKEDIGRDNFLKRAWQWKEKYAGEIVDQIKKLGASCDWSRQRFTMDEGLSRAVREFFVLMYEKGLIYRGEKIINWCPSCLTSISDAEVDFKEQDSNFWYIKYQIDEEDRFLEIATTRPETLLGDTALAVNPDDDRYKDLIGKKAVVPLINRVIPIVGDSYVEKDFGTGVVKITPAHDPNDFEVGLRHNLEIIKIMDEKAVMNENAGNYFGLDRYEARKKIVSDLKNKGYLIKTEGMKHNVGTCYRCGEVIEPYVSTQWFMKMKPLAKPAIEIVKEGKIKFIPERFNKIYYHWMENVKDWCISRQLWWGHRIPAWYCKDCGDISVSREDINNCKKCGSGNIYQDEDTLDTWFSSALWPFSVLGWPDNTADMEYYYPTDTLVTGYDIIFFWVARMIFTSKELLDKEPFKNVFIHGLVRDAQGRKMSKSLGNGIDPIEVIEKYGADALRFALVTGNSPGNDMRFSDEKILAARSFANKIWNAARFIHMNVDGFNVENKIPENIGSIEKWIISRLNEVTKEVKINIENFEIGVALQKLYDFIWDEFCDWYIEMSKIRIREKSDDLQSVMGTLVYVMTSSMRLLHPFMPYITEKIWLSFVHDGESVMLASYPSYDEKLKFISDENEIGAVIEIVRGIRNKRNEMNIPLNKKPKIYLIENDVFDIRKYIDIIRSLTGSSEVILCKNMEEKNAVSIITRYFKIYIPIDELINKKEEIERLEKSLKEANENLFKTGKQLSNEKFVSRAPESVVSQVRANYENLKKRILELETEIKSLK